MNVSRKAENLISTKWENNIMKSGTGIFDFITEFKKVTGNPKVTESGNPITLKRSYFTTHELTRKPES